MNTTILRKILMAIFIPMIITVLILILVLTNISYKQDAALARNTSKAYAEQISQSVHDRFLSTTGMMKLTAENLADLPFASAEAKEVAEHMIISLLESHDAIYSAWFVFDEGVFEGEGRYRKDYIPGADGPVEIFDLGDEVLDNPEESPWYNVTRNTGEIYFDNVDYYDYGMGDGELYTGTISMPISLNGEVIGVIGMDTLYPNMFDLLAEMQVSGERNVMIISQNGVVLYEPSEQLVNHALSEYDFSDMDSIQAALTAREVYTTEMYSPFLTDEAYIYINEVDVGNAAAQPVFLYVEVPTSLLYQEARLSTIIITTAILFSLLLITAIVVFNVRRMIMPIKSLTKDATRVAAGELEITFADYPSESKDEIIILHNAFKQMLHSLKEMEAEREAFAANLEHKVKERTQELRLMTQEAEEAKERALNAAEVKTQFLANMSHEIRTPMNAILGMSELLLSEDLNNRQMRYVKDIKISSNALLNIINDILDLSKIEAGKLSLVPVHYDFHILIDNVNSMLSFITKDKGIEYRFMSYGEMPRCIYGDDVRLRQVLLNILGNAVKFTKEGYVQLEIIVGDSEIEFDIHDTGIGIQPEAIDSLFDAFAQTDVVRNRTIKGTGLGLSITKNLVEMMQGKICVESVYGQGSIFRITIPKVIGDESQLKPVESEEEILYAPEAKILVVDDNEINLNVALGLLRLHGIVAHKVLSGAEAIATVQKERYDIVFMDHMMPEMDGLEATKRIRELGVEFQSMPIIALSANAISGAKEMFIAAGLDDFISKPIEKMKLNEMLKKWLPQEKQQKKNEDAAQVEETEEPTGLWTLLEDMEEINLELGLSRVGGQRDVYEKSISLFSRSIPVFCKKVKVYLADGDLHNYSIEVHGVKGSLSNIGAMRLSDQAYELEMAGKMGNLQFCQANTEPLIKELQLLEQAFESVQVVEQQSREQGNEAMLNEKCQLLVEALDAFEQEQAAAILDELQGYDFGAEKNEILVEIRNAVDAFDFDTAMAETEKIK